MSRGTVGGVLVEGDVLRPEVHVNSVQCNQFNLTVSGWESSPLIKKYLSYSIFLI